MHTILSSAKNHVPQAIFALADKIVPNRQGMLSDSDPATLAAQSKHKLLLIEDHQSLIDGILPRLTALYDVTIHNDIDAVQHLIREQHVDFAVVDLILNKKLDGLRVMPVLREQGIPFLVFSGTADDWHQRASLRMGARGFVDKRSGLTELFDAITNVQTGRLVFPAELLLELRNDPTLIFPEDIKPSEMRLIDKIFELVQPGEERVPTVAVLAAAMNLRVGYVNNMFQQLFNRFGLETRDRETLYRELKRHGFFPGVLTTSFAHIIDV